MIASVFLSVLGISMSVSLIIIVLLLFTPFLNKRYAAKWKYWIWIFLALRLLIPYSGNMGRAAAAIQLQEETQNIPKSGEQNIDDPTGPAGAPRRFIVEVPSPLTASITASTEKKNASVTILDIIALIWMSGGLVFLLVHLISYLHYKRQVAGKGKIVKDTRILCQMIRLKRALHIRSEIRVVEYPEAASPMMIGFFRPVLILPDEQYRLEELFFILKHELIHWKRKDVYMKLLFAAANAVHWFNPLIWIMQKEAAVDMELSCDEQVTRDADFSVRKAYTETLLSTLHKQCTKKTVLSTQFYGGKEIMKKRFKNILIWTRKKNGAAVLICAVILTVCLGTMIGCSAAKDNEEDTFEQTENNEQDAGADTAADDGNGTDDLSYDGDLLADNASGEDSTVNPVSEQDSAASDKRTLTIMKEGEPEEKQASLVIEDGYLFYLPDGEWQKNAEGTWQAVVNDKVRIWAERYDRENLSGQIQGGRVQLKSGSVDVEFSVEGVDLSGELPDADLASISLSGLSEEMMYMAKLYGDGNDVWCVFYCYPVEAEEGWGRELPVIADTFAVTVMSN